VHVALLVTALGLALAFARRAGGSARSAALVGVLALFAVFPGSTARTQVFGYVLFVGVFWLLASDVVAPSRRVFLVLPLLVLWANLHGSVVLGVGLVLLWALAQLIRCGRRRNVWRVRFRAVGLAAVAALCPLASPYAASLPGYYADILGSSSFRNLVTEWKPTTFPEQLPFYVLAIGGLWLVARKPGRLSLFEHLAFIATLVAGFDGVRFIVWFGLVAVMVVPRALDDVWPAGAAPFRRRVNLTLALVALLAVIVGVGATAARPARWFTPEYPVRAADSVAAATARDPSLRVFANEKFADWLIWKHPRLAGRVAFDARFELLSSRQLYAIGHFRDQSSAHWLDAARGYGLLVLDPQHEPGAISQVLRERGTRRLYRDKHVAVLLRSTAS
jgi:hypothetical protein